MFASIEEAGEESSRADVDNLMKFM